MEERLDYLGTPLPDLLIRQREQIEELERDADALREALYRHDYALYALGAWLEANEDEQAVLPASHVARVIADIGAYGSDAVEPEWLAPTVAEVTPGERPGERPGGGSRRDPSSSLAAVALVVAVLFVLGAFWALGAGYYVWAVVLTGCAGFSVFGASEAASEGGR